MALNNIFVDTSWYKALLDPRDDFNSDAKDQMEKLLSKKYFFVTTNFIVDETLTLLRLRAGLPLALKFADTLVDMSKIMKLTRVSEIDEKEAWKWFPENWSKLSFTDCTSFAVMNRLRMKDVATFDNHFARAGFIVFK